MMKGIYRHIFSAFTLAAVMIIHGGCMEQMDDTIIAQSEYISFKATLDCTGSMVPTKGLAGIMEWEEEEWIVHTDAVTKASLYSSLNEAKTAGVYGYIYSGDWSADLSPMIDIIDGNRHTFDGDELVADEPIRWKIVEDMATDQARLRTFVYAPKEALVPSYQTPADDDDPAEGAPVINIPDIFAKDAKGQYIYQTDILVADHETVIDLNSKSHREDIPLDFGHIFTAVQFKAGFDCTITGISLSGVNTGGNYVMGSGWEDLTGSAYSADLDTDGSIMLMIPQAMPVDGDAVITLKYKENGGSEQTLSASLNGVEWKHGKKITYTLKKESERKYVYLDLAAGEVKITGSSYSGYVFVGEEPEKIAGTIAAGQEYYIYQSCVSEANKDSKNYKVGWSSYDKEQQQGTGILTLPSYPLVTYKDPLTGEEQLWSDFITDNDNVEKVIEAWDDSKGANGNTGFAAGKAVRRAGRESTKNKIYVSGTVNDCKMIIDNIYCSYQHKGANRKDGSIAFIPTWKSNSSLSLNLIGDSRIGCLHYHNNNGSDKGSDQVRLVNTNNLIIEGEGSLTIADADFYTSSGGYYSNHYDSALGNSDNLNSTYGIIINGGTIFAGTTAAENSSAIGAGGNGYGDVVINGGVVTAVASTTGTAIGGGIGFSDTGGQGYVEINGGNVYAYNHKHSSNIPSSAIGGAGSSAQAGSKGTVIITGGSVYAQSALGTAIGGGSSQTKQGGPGYVTITGGTVIAKSLSSISAGIGGGSTCTGGGTCTAPNGGTAVVTIGDKDDKTKNPIVRTGSIGGGGTKATGGTVGNAQAYVYGGDIQAQFVMAKSKGNVFEMHGGVIRNSSTSDDTYFCIKEHGAAVYMEQGSFTMWDGTIKKCFADKTSSAKGGAVYIKGDSETTFTMHDGEICECRANADGGAVYLEGGNVTINGGAIDGNVAYNGNGGAISILGGNFTMDGPDAFIYQNAAFNRDSGTNGNGGGIYVAPAQNSSSTINVVLKEGKIQYNSSDRNGGGVCVDMGSNDSAILNVTSGVESDGAATDKMSINQNNSMVKGGGMYVRGAKANVVLNDGYVLDNQTSPYQVNQDVTVEEGLVTLKKPGITTQVTIIFSNNAQYYTQGTAGDITAEQYIVASSLSKINKNTFVEIDDYYNTFAGWNTRRDGKGTSYDDESLVSLNESIVLYAQWN